AAEREQEAQALELARGSLYAKSVFTGHRDVMRTVAFSPDSRFVVSADEAGDIAVSTAAGGTGVEGLPPGGGGQQADFSPDRSLVAAANGSGRAIVWRWRTGEQVSLKEPHGLDGATFGPGGRLVALSVDDGTIRLWDWRAGRVISVLDSKDGVVSGAVF